ncbi:Ras-related protein Rab-27B [Balamuthia mandrillaris]
MLVGNRYFPGVPQIFLRKKHGLFICYDSTDLASFLKLNQWLANVDDLANECQDYRQAARLLVACKCDRQDECQVSEEMAEEMAVKWGAFAHIRTSAKTKENVEEAIRMLVEATLDPFARLPQNQRP